MNNNDSENQEKLNTDIEIMEDLALGEDINIASEDYVIDFDNLEEQLINQLESDVKSGIAELDFLKSQRDQIQNPEKIGNVLKDVVWEQCMNQIATVAGEDFIEENRGLTLDLRKSSHIQTGENFEKGRLATHNQDINYQEKYDEWQTNFQKNEDGSIKMKWNRRAGEMEKVLADGARAPFDDNRPKGDNQNHMDHTISAAELIRSSEANAFVDKDELINFANSEDNLNLLDSSANDSKSDLSMEVWLNSEHNGEKPAERFNIDEEKLREKDKQARKKLNELKEKGKEQAKKTGMDSLKKEAKNIGGKAFRTMIMQLLMEFLKKVTTKIVSWIKSAKKSIKSLLEHLKEAVHDFVMNLKQTLLNVGDGVLTTIFTAIFGPIVRIVKKVWIMLKQGWHSLKDAITYMRNPENKNKPVAEKMAQIGKIVIGGLSGIGAIALGELFEGLLMQVPPLAIEIPVIGSLANILGIFLGALVAGIVGAIALNCIDRAITKKETRELTNQIINKGNEVLSKQYALQDQLSNKIDKKEDNTIKSMQERHQCSDEFVKKTLEKLKQDQESSNKKHDKRLDEMLKLLNK